MLSPLFCRDDLIVRDVDCAPRDVVYVKSIAAAYDGLCCLFAEKGGTVRLVAPKGREAELDLLVKDLLEELATSNVSAKPKKNVAEDPLQGDPSCSSLLNSGA